MSCEALSYSPAAIAMGLTSVYLVLSITGKKIGQTSFLPLQHRPCSLLWLTAVAQRAVAVIYWDKSILVNSFCDGWLVA